MVILCNVAARSVRQDFGQGVAVIEMALDSHHSSNTVILLTIFCMFRYSHLEQRNSQKKSNFSQMIFVKKMPNVYCKALLLVQSVSPIALVFDFEHFITISDILL